MKKNPTTSHKQGCLCWHGFMQNQHCTIFLLIALVLTASQALSGEHPVLTKNIQLNYVMKTGEALNRWEYTWVCKKDIFLKQAWGKFVNNQSDKEELVFDSVFHLNHAYTSHISPLRHFNFDTFLNYRCHFFLSWVLSQLERSDSSDILHSLYIKSTVFL